MDLVELSLQDALDASDDPEVNYFIREALQKRMARRVRESEDDDPDFRFYKVRVGGGIISDAVSLDECGQRESSTWIYSSETVEVRADGGREMVLVKPGKKSNSRSVFHVPDPEDPLVPKCGQSGSGPSSYRRVERRQFPNRECCMKCAGETTQPSNQGPQLAAKLRAMDADDLRADGGESA